MKLITLLLSIFFVSPVFAQNLHLIDSEPETGFAIYRMGQPDADEIKRLCDLGVEEIFVLSGNADKHELKHQDQCPSLRVVYNEKQNPKKPLTNEFLEDFDNWVSEARTVGKKIAFRCNCGCHRTGRLAAYYQMKYQKITASDAIAIMMKHGKWMILYPSLDNQVRALEDYIKGRECRQKTKYCVMPQFNQEQFEYAEGSLDKASEI